MAARGFLGVDTFFVISGYLIAMLLINEYEKTGTINILQFWIRRMKRLFPPVLFMILIVIQYIIFLINRYYINLRKMLLQHYYIFRTGGIYLMDLVILKVLKLDHLNIYGRLPSKNSSICYFR